MTNPFDQSDLQARAAQLVSAAQKAGADHADAVAVRGVSLSVQVRQGKVEESERSEADDIGLRVFVGQKTATISTNTQDDPALFAERAVAMARVAPDDDYAGLAMPDQLATAFPSLDLLDRTDVSAEALFDRALAAEEAALSVSDVSASGGASASWGIGGLVLVSSNGFEGAYLSSRHSVSAMAIAGQGTGMERDYDYTSRQHGEDLDDPAQIGRNAGERAVRRLGASPLDTQAMPVLFEPRAATSLISHFIGAINGASIARGSSFLKDSMGEAIFADALSISDDPLVRRGLSSRPFDGEGLAPEKLDLVKDGVLQHWLLDLASARELGLRPNGRARRSTGSAPRPGASNIVVSAGTQSPDEMLSQAGTALLVTDLIGHGVNAVTGDYSRGASGFLVENGKITRPVTEITIAGRLQDMFRSMQAANDQTDRYGMTCPSLLIEGLTIAGR